MEHEKVERLNELARKKKSVGLTEEELAEQAVLRREYLDGWRENMKAILDNAVIERPDGTREPLKKKEKKLQ